MAPDDGLGKMVGWRALLQPSSPRGVPCIESCDLMERYSQYPTDQGDYLADEDTWEDRRGGSFVVLEVPQVPVAPAELSQKDLGQTGSADKPVYKIKVSLPPQATQNMQVNPSTQAGVRVEAEILLGHKPLIKWFFERSGS